MDPSVLPLTLRVVIARNYRPMRRAIDPEDHLFPTVYLNSKAHEFSVVRTDHRSNEQFWSFGSSDGQTIKLVTAASFILSTPLESIRNDCNELLSLQILNISNLIEFLYYR